VEVSRRGKFLGNVASFPRITGKFLLSGRSPQYSRKSALFLDILKVAQYLPGFGLTLLYFCLFADRTVGKKEG
jgi:hypothetical protein